MAKKAKTVSAGDMFRDKLMTIDELENEARESGETAMLLRKDEAVTIAVKISHDSERGSFEYVFDHTLNGVSDISRAQAEGYVLGYIPAVDEKSV